MRGAAFHEESSSQRQPSFTNVNINICQIWPWLLQVISHYHEPSDYHRSFATNYALWWLIDGQQTVIPMSGWLVS